MLLFNVRALLHLNLLLLQTDPLIARQYSNGLAADTIKGCDVQVFADESKQSDFRIARSLAKILE